MDMTPGEGDVRLTMMVEMIFADAAVVAVATCRPPAFFARVPGAFSLW